MYDDYNIEEQWLKLKEYLEDFQKLDSDVYSFIGKKTFG